MKTKSSGAATAAARLRDIAYSGLRRVKAGGITRLAYRTSSFVSRFSLCRARLSQCYAGNGDQP
jgi:hypothetical protein